MPRLFFEDFTPDSARICGRYEVSQDDIIAFAREYDPQPYHIDPGAAKDTFVAYAPELEDFILPQASDIAAAIEDLARY